jgi:cytochrome c5
VSFTLAIAVAFQLTLTAEPAKPAPAAGESAADQIDASGLPAEQKARFELFRQKCGKCHALSRALTAQLSDAAWKRHMKHMSLRPNSAISSEQAQSILEFLKFHASQRAPR